MFHFPNLLSLLPGIIYQIVEDLMGPEILGIWKAEAGGSQVQGLPGLQNESEAKVYKLVRPCLRIKVKDRGLGRWSVFRSTWCLLLQRSPGQLPAPKPGSSQPPVTPALEDPMHSSSLHRYCTYMSMHTCIHTHAHSQIEVVKQI